MTLQQRRLYRKARRLFPHWSRDMRWRWVRARIQCDCLPRVAISSCVHLRVRDLFATPRTLRSAVQLENTVRPL